MASGLAASGLRVTGIWILLKAILLASVIQLHAGIPEMAMFYDELSPHGDWVEDKDQGPVWFPNKVEENWRPYVDGRWVPTPNGWVFETQEPWGWATYHYGNWFLTVTHGWVWAPGTTWYPSTVTWRQGKDAIGWAPIPPPKYVPEPEILPPAVVVQAPATPVVVTLPPPVWVFAPGPAFLLGLGEPYAQEYSYAQSQALYPPEELPELFPLTELISNFVAAAEVPEAVYNWGPSYDQVSSCSGVSSVSMVSCMRVTNITAFYPPGVILANRPYLRRTLPPSPSPAVPVRATQSMTQASPSVRQVPPGVPAPRQDWRAKAGAVQEQARRQPGQPLKGTSLPAKAVKTTAGVPVPKSQKVMAPKVDASAVANRKEQLAQNRAAMEQQKQQVKPDRAQGPESPKAGGSPPGPGTVKTPPSTERKTTPKKSPPSASPQVKPKTPSKDLVAPPTAKELAEKRKQEKDADLAKKRQAQGLAPPSKPGGSAPKATTPGGVGSAKPSPSGGGVRPPKSAPGTGTPGAPPGGVRPPKGGPGGGAGSGGQGGPKVAPSQPRTPTPRGRGGSGGDSGEKPKKKKK